ncbi:hypothetical protein [Sutcliffiella horikoshii]|uniref:hypothetical protein n=1 Tax=Sutcliffiella horikoshii TaxID=79883 RepID=UPI0038509393
MSIPKEKILETYDNLEDFYLQLPPYDTREYEVQITDLVKYDKGELLPLANKILFESDDSLIRFSAFVTIATSLRRQKNTSKLKMFLSQYIEEFGDNPIYKHIFAMSRKMDGTKEGVLASIEYSHEALNLLKENHPGVVHSYAEAVATAIEKGYIQDLHEARNAIEALNAVMESDECSQKYAKFYCTLGRLYAIEKNYELAKEKILLAIDEEDSESKDYAIRIGDYQLQLFDIQVKEQLENSLTELKTQIHHAEQTLTKQMSESEKNLAAQKEELAKLYESQVEEMKSEVKELKTENLKMLGFFTAILTLTMGSIQVISTQEFHEASLLILVLMGGLLIVYAGFNLIVSTRGFIVSILVGISSLLIIVITVSIYTMYLFK